MPYLLCARCGSALASPPEHGRLCADCAIDIESVSAEVLPSNPEHTASPLFRFPVTTWLIVITILYSFIFTIADRSWQWGAPWGAMFSERISAGEWWRLLTSIFLHVQLSHLVSNIIPLWILGKRVERIWGGWIFAIFYLSCGVVGNLASAVAHPSSGGYGASGAVLGICGGLISIYLPRFRSLKNLQRLKLALLIVFAVLCFTSSNRIDATAHEGGLLAGLVIGSMLVICSHSSPKLK